MTVFPHSALATKLLSGLQGIEIGGAAHNPFGLNTKNVDFTDHRTVFKQLEIEHCGTSLPVDIVANGDHLPFDDNQLDFVISSHVIEHFYDPIAAIKEWLRVTKHGGLVFMIVPHKDRIFDRDEQETTAEELILRHNSDNRPEINSHEAFSHWSFWTPVQFLTLCSQMKWHVAHAQDPDDKVGNGFTVVIRKTTP